MSVRPLTSENLDKRLDVGKLKNMLEQFGEFPEKYRLLTWKQLLRLPCNRTAFEKLNSGTHLVLFQ